MGNTQSVHEVFAQLAFQHGLSRIAVAGGDDAHAGAQFLFTADAREATGFENAQQAHLHFRRHLDDFVQEQRAALGAFAAAAMHFRRAGERTLLVAEELRLDQVSGIAPQLTAMNGALADSLRS